MTTTSADIIRVNDTFANLIAGGIRAGQWGYATDVECLVIRDEIPGVSGYTSAATANSEFTFTSAITIEDNLTVNNNIITSDDFILTDNSYFKLEFGYGAGSSSLLLENTTGDIIVHGQYGITLSASYTGSDILLDSADAITLQSDSGQILLSTTGEIDLYSRATLSISAADDIIIWKAPSGALNERKAQIDLKTAGVTMSATDTVGMYANTGDILIDSQTSDVKIDAFNSCNITIDSGDFIVDSTTGPGDIHLSAGNNLYISVNDSGSNLFINDIETTDSITFNTSSDYDITVSKGFIINVTAT
jgi:hypothetical protein